MRHTFVFDTFQADQFAEAGIAMPKAGKVKSIVVTPASALATDATDYITGTIARRDSGDYTTADTIGTFTTNSSGGAALVAFTPTTVTISSLTNASFSAADVLTFKLVDAGTTTEPLMTVAITVEFS